ncbi:DUF427 domain-containing protein [Roseinatronobacter bogoriensis]|uniref:Nucleotidyltransferase domain-containing protein n=1 Tax=Roseinatronobacter bogoriensis subsp. barguzinensis TaxID=441209 RepID=A0A2K8KEP0_9RHOB|nr:MULTISPECIES: DUF427 domain-containing protein [Rhodobaca]ATX67892.1 nucleotidyltransferase domain-containing protein [Rhodobaca barguzinensis]MBB4207750.1 uncharacterized protein (DUF427 family) [Rhodobaca bogoriensis DSM 18756]TDW39942.1 uncharacterized protein (DUF427 family) [Rhodobaca barguzinensis]TDY70904.1 uncharacterized protein (DUF427 family) [Rhodobaca bogoriensis DSM 18756]
MSNVRIYPAVGKWVVRANGSVIGESTRALELLQRDYPFVIYFPREDIASAVLDASDRPFICDDRGTGVHFHVSSPEGVIQNAAYSLTDPTPEAAELREYLAFDAGKVTVERV